MVHVVLQESNSSQDSMPVTAFSAWSDWGLLVNISNCVVLGQYFWHA